MTSEWEQVNVDAADPAALGRWWTEALGWAVVNAPDEYEVRPDPDRCRGRSSSRWKLHTLGQGYADGLAGLARDFGVDVVDEAPEEPAGRAPAADSDGS
ncbi:VOC family protein [Streptomyces mutabilis]|uniref:VOC family protein n=1 Tax=Streptomyces mutabilis TaxID=67332 RepID=UPI0026D01E1E